MRHSSTIAGFSTLFCGNVGALFDRNAQMMHARTTLFRNFRVPLQMRRPITTSLLRHLQESSSNADDDILHGLDGEVELRHEWSCAGQCEPIHERQDATPGDANREDDPIDRCIEEVQTGTLQRQVDFDLQCLGENYSCNDIESIDYHEELWTHCNQDPDMLYGECVLVCRFGLHPTRRCTYEFDRAGTYGLSSVEGLLLWSHCALLTDCDETTLVETMGLYCNKSAVDLPPPSRIEATAGPLPEPDMSGGSDSAVDASDDGEGHGVLIGVLGAAGGVAMGGLGVFALYKVLGKKATHAGAGGAGGGGGGGGGPPDEGTGHPSVVVGRPVAESVNGGVAPPAGAALDDKTGGAAAGTPLGGDSSSAPKDV